MHHASRVVWHLTTITKQTAAHTCVWCRPGRARWHRCRPDCPGLCRVGPPGRSHPRLAPWDTHTHTHGRYLRARISPCMLGSGLRFSAIVSQKVTNMPPWKVKYGDLCIRAVIERELCKSCGLKCCLTIRLWINISTLTALEKLRSKWTGHFTLFRFLFVSTNHVAGGGDL